MYLHDRTYKSPLLLLAYPKHVFVALLIEKKINNNSSHRIALHHGCSLNAVALKATIIIYPTVEPINWWEGRDWSRDSWFRANICHWPRRWAVQGGTCTVAPGHPYLHAWGEAESFARQELGRAIRTRNTNSPNTINYFPRNILSFCFTSNYRPPIVPFRPLSTI